MQVTRQDIVKVAALAKLELPESELELVADKFNRVLDFVAQLNQVNTVGVDEMAHPVDVHSVLREDVLRPSLPREVALANAPKSDGEFFLVPPVLG
jgi:aspartyl-tRNA(Asn)/glutamyl-tRNA(Gln) amidotransferase subunit C